jgi:predicted RNA polymerase sigma factor
LIAAVDAVAVIPEAAKTLWAACRVAGLAETQDADRACERAIGLESDPAVRRFLQGKRDGLRNATL